MVKGAQRSLTLTKVDQLGPVRYDGEKGAIRMARTVVRVIKVPVYQDDGELLAAMPPYGRGAWLREVAKRAVREAGAASVASTAGTGPSGVSVTPAAPAAPDVPALARQIEEEVADWLRTDIVPELIGILREEVAKAATAAPKRGGERPGARGADTAMGESIAFESDDNAGGVGPSGTAGAETWQPTEEWVRSLRG